MFPVQPQQPDNRYQRPCALQYNEGPVADKVRSIAGKPGAHYVHQKKQGPVFWDQRKNIHEISQ